MTDDEEQRPTSETEVEEDLTGEEAVPYLYSTTSYGADYPVDSLVKRMREDSIYVPEFQRGFVWNLPKASRFIESLLLGLPVPAIFLSREEESQRLLVIDGQQRLRSMQYFYDGKFPTATGVVEFALKDVPSGFNGETYASLSAEDRRRLDDAIVHAIIVKQDEPSDDQSSVFHIFERLNTGGMILQPQEIRHAIYSGPFNDLLKELNQNEDWRTIYGPPAARMKDEELILRFIALQLTWKDYKAPMKDFLNKFMGRHRTLKRLEPDQLKHTFEGTIELVNEALGRRAFRPRGALNVAVFDSAMVGLEVRLTSGAVTKPESVVQQYDRLLANQSYMAATTTGTSQEENVRKRLTLAIEAFGHIA